MRQGVPGRETVLVIPAAGAGSRLQSSTPKVLSPVNGRPMIDHLLERYREAVAGFVLVVHPSFESRVRSHVSAAAPDLDVEYVAQAEPTGMLDAILLAIEAVRKHVPRRVWITWCDQVGVHPETIATLASVSSEHPDAAVVLPTSQQSDPYVHLERDGAGRIVAIRHRREGDAMPPVGESDMGLFSLSPQAFFVELPQFGLETTQAQGTRERNFLPFMPWLTGRGQAVVTFPSTNGMEAIGINTPDDRRRLEQYLKGLDHR
jgi:bifunctional UDP-N-acetylglucosamine pyrophosphorylase / glucosamine-1-phosphate N-acetyltransferase